MAFLMAPKKKGKVKDEKESIRERTTERKVPQAEALETKKVKGGKKALALPNLPMAPKKGIF